MLKTPSVMIGRRRPIAAVVDLTAQVGHVGVGKAHRLGPAESAAVDDAGVV
jgi:hypothetical protein